MSDRQQVLLIDDNHVLGTSSKVDMKYVILPHPKNANVVYIVLNNEIFEIQNHEPRVYASWFIDQRVCSNPSLYIASKIDIRFLLLPFIEKAIKYSPLDQLLTYVQGCDKLSNYIGNVRNWRLEEMCDVNDKYDELYYRYNEAKALSWLQQKSLRCAVVLYTKRLRSSTCKAFDDGFNSSAQQKPKPSTAVDDVSSSSSATAAVKYQDEDIKQAVGIVCDYLSDKTVSVFTAHMTSIGLLAASASASSSAPSSDSTSSASSSAPSSDSTSKVDDAGVGAGQKRKASWEADLEMERETLAYFAGGATSNATSASAPEDKVSEV
jgi:hypothetical protein